MAENRRRFWMGISTERLQFETKKKAYSATKQHTKSTTETITLPFFVPMAIDKDTVKLKNRGKLSRTGKKNNEADIFIRG